MSELPRITSKRYDAICHQILEDGKVIALIDALTDGRWILDDCNGRRINKRTYGSPEAALEGFKEMAAAPPSP
jgi:hypothetical protein